MTRLTLTALLAKISDKPAKVPPVDPKCQNQVGEETKGTLTSDSPKYPADFLSVTSALL